MIKKALISVTDKSGLEVFAQGLVALAIQIISTGGTARFLRDHDIPVTDVSDLTGFPEILDGRVKTLHPKIAGAILSVRDNPAHREQCAQQGIEAIDMVVVNLYAFEETIAKPDVSLEDAIENIDIGGPTLIRAAAKNHHDVAVVTDPADYPGILEELQEHQGQLTSAIKLNLAQKAFALTNQYDAAIAQYLGTVTRKEESVFPDNLSLNFQKKQELRYGENPHQRAALYVEPHAQTGSLAHAKQLHGKELSFNNFLDTDAVLGIIKEFDEPACAIIKHSNPAGVAIDKKNIELAFDKALACDPISAFGGIIGINRCVTKKLAHKIQKNFYEVVIAPDFDKEALEILKLKKNLRLLQLDDIHKTQSANSWDLRKLHGALLVQDEDSQSIDVCQCKIASKRQPTEQEWQAMTFLWKVVRHVKSNAIIFGHSDRTIGVGAGQMSRIDSTKIAAMKAQSPLKGTIMASDAFFPFRDNIDEAAKLGVTAIISPGGSVRDEEVVAAADENDIAMVFTGMRHFRH
jgi:phosphoribosylaminoimidazolecarboxamide formyltransferase / IMP cyclohydrolase